ncbi:MAG: hypothetical protein IIA02_03265 [Proteobacteria bacterium]|uniref:hypothetical protein n=1 Tax=Aquabacterium sp. TaxID=1872578 RepID=UPI0035C688DC|nr:hypothetical protein [Pseudomonadota bacterium]
MTRLRPLLTAGLLSALGLLATPAAHAAPYSFNCITGGNAQSCTDGQAHLDMEVTSAGAGLVDFTFHNLSALGSSITEIYFDDGTLLGIASVIDSGNGVTFSQIGSATPGNLPGGNKLSPAFVATQGFMVDTGSGSTTKGVENKLEGGALEFVTIRFNLINGKTFADTLAALNGPLGDGNDLRVGLHVRSFSTGNSESFVNAAPVPEPDSAWLVLAALGVTSLLQTRRR